MSDEKLGHRLINAAEDGDLKKVKYLVEKKGANINFSYTRSYSPRSPLIAAVEDGSIDIVRYLVGKGVDLSSFDLMQAVDKSEIFDFLVEQNGVSFEYTNFPQDDSVLRFACKHRDLQLVKRLLAKGASLEEYYKPMLFTAVKHNVYSHKGTSEELAELLLAAGADVNLQYKNQSPLSVACRNREYGVARILLEHGAKVQQGRYNSLVYACLQCDDPQLIISMICHEPGCLNAVGEDYKSKIRTPLGAAVYCLDYKYVWILKLSGGELSEKEQHDYEGSEKEQHNYKGLENQHDDETSDQEYLEDTNFFTDNDEERYEERKRKFIQRREKAKLRVNAALCIKQWIPAEHKLYPTEIKDAIKCIVLVAKRLNWNLDNAIMRHIISFIPFGWYTFRPLQEMYKQAKRGASESQKRKNKKHKQI